MEQGTPNWNNDRKYRRMRLRWRLAQEMGNPRWARIWMNAICQYMGREEWIR